MNEGLKGKVLEIEYTLRLGQGLCVIDGSY
jgi:hypothetical protein